MGLSNPPRKIRTVSGLGLSLNGKGSGMTRKGYRAEEIVNTRCGMSPGCPQGPTGTFFLSSSKTLESTQEISRLPFLSLVTNRYFPSRVTLAMYCV